MITVNQEKSDFKITDDEASDASSQVFSRDHGRVLAQNMSESGYHPVIIFGTSYSGKSSLLGSLLACFQIDATHEIGISLGESLMPVDSPDGEQANRYAEALYYRSMQEYIGGQGHQATMADFPFFVPVIIRPKNRAPIKFALMESRGEWYKPDPNSDRFFKQLKKEVEAILVHYEKGISFIYLAPYTQSFNRGEAMAMDRERAELKDADLALVGVFDAYERKRKDKENDSHMLLVTKWDESKPREATLIDVLDSPDLGAVEAFIGERYPQGFAAFKGLSLNGKQRSVMQYCAGLFEGREIRKPPAELIPVLLRYPHTIWNWLHANTGHMGDLVPKRQTPKEGFVQRILRWISELLQ